MKKSFLVIGLGNFGWNLAANLVKFGNDVMVIDSSEKKVSEFEDKYHPSNSFFGDCTTEVAIKNIGVKNFDVCFVTLSSNFQASLQITSNLKKFGAKHIISKAQDEFQETLLYSSGADKVINPEKEIAQDIARIQSSNNVFDYMEMNDGFAVADIKVPPSLIGKTIKDSNVRKTYNINIFAIKIEDGRTFLPDPAYVFHKGDSIKIVGTQESIKKFR